MIRFVGSRPPAVLAATALLAAAGPAPASAADPVLDEVVVTANRTAVPRAAVGSSTTVITRDEIERLQATDVADVLRRVPGVAVSHSGGAGQQTAVRIRGAEGYHTLVLVDGVEVADVSGTQQATDFGHLLAADIDRIEIVRGPQSTLYGADAIGGVIQIFTRKGTRKPASSATLEGGSYGTAIAKASTTGRYQGFGYALGILGRSVDGFSSADSRNGNREADSLREGVFDGRFDLQATDNLSFEGTLRRSRAEQNYDSTNFSGFPVDDIDNVQKTSAGSGRLAAVATSTDGSLRNETSVSYAQTRRDLFDGKVKTNFFDSWKDKLDDQVTWKASQSLTLVGGLEVERERASFDTFEGHVTSRAAFGEAVTKPLDDLTVTFGGRVDDHGTFGVHTTYQGTASYTVKATDSRLHGSVGTGFRAPSLYELYAPPVPAWGLAVVGNASLQPEESLAYDLGVEQTLWGGKAVIDVTAFLNRTTNLIQWGNGYENIASARSFGLENSLDLTLSDDLGVAANYTYLEARDNQSGGTLRRRAKHAGRIGPYWDVTKALRLDVDWVYEGRRPDGAGVYLGGYGRVDMRVAYDLSPSWRLFGRIENLFDKHYEEVDGYGTPGLSGYAGVTARF